MDNQRIDAALRQASDTRRVVLGAGALDAVDETFAQCFENAPAVVADENTFAAAGRAATGSVMPRLPQPDDELAEKLVQ